MVNLNPIDLFACVSNPAEYQKCLAPALIEVTQQELHRYFNLTSTDEKMLFIMGHRNFADQIDVTLKVAPAEHVAPLQKQISKYNIDTARVINKVKVNVELVAIASEKLNGIIDKVMRHICPNGACTTISGSVPSKEYGTEVQWISAQHAMAKAALHNLEMERQYLATDYPKLSAQFRIWDETVRTPGCSNLAKGEYCWGSYPDPLYETYSFWTRHTSQGALEDSWNLWCDTNGPFDGCPWSGDVTILPALLPAK